MYAVINGAAAAFPLKNSGVFRIICRSKLINIEEGKSRQSSTDFEVGSKNLSGTHVVS